MSDIWSQLDAHHNTVKSRSILSLFDADRFDGFSAQGAGLLLDYSKTNIDAQTKAMLLSLLEERGVSARRDAMFSGEAINETEGRAVLHTALRGGEKIMVDGEDVRPEVLATLKRMADFATKLRSGAIAAENGEAFTDVINIGIGGSDLGPVMAVEALRPYCDGPRTHFVSNIDSAHIADVLQACDPARTLVLIASKTFTTIETMTNAETAKAWLAKAVENPGSHMAALSSAQDKTSAYGIDPERVFGFEDWVGGRYSLWGPIGLSIMLAIGPDNFEEFLAGGAEMDRHFQEAPAEENLPMLLAATGIWHRNICDYASRAVLPYEQRLLRFPAYLQQLDMESNGKSVAMDGSTLTRESGPVVWGEPGTNGQHAFYQLIHQGTSVIPCEFLLARHPHEPDLVHQHRLLQANCLAQSEALMLGRDIEEARKLMAEKGLEGEELERQAAHRVFTGNRPSVTIIYDKLTPRILGRLIALYEHRVFVEGVVWGVNSFDQWGVELGKVLAVQMLPLIEVGDASEKDGSTHGLVRALTKPSA